ncbi:hypothetical protein V6L77_04295 [Pannonibacter sp. Pt2-lr]
MFVIGLVLGFNSFQLGQHGFVLETAFRCGCEPDAVRGQIFGLKNFLLNGSGEFQQSGREASNGAGRLGGFQFTGPQKPFQQQGLLKLVQCHIRNIGSEWNGFIGNLRQLSSDFLHLKKACNSNDQHHRAEKADESQNLGGNRAETAYI